MAAEWICDGCGKRAPGVTGRTTAQWFKPEKWFSRADEDGIQDACSRECVETVARSSGKSGLVMPL